MMTKGQAWRSLANVIQFKDHFDFFFTFFDIDRKIKEIESILSNDYVGRVALTVKLIFIDQSANEMNFTYEDKKVIFKNLIDHLISSFRRDQKQIREKLDAVRFELKIRLK